MTPDPPRDWCASSASSGARGDRLRLTASSVGARRANVLFDATGGERTVPLVATILPTSEIEVEPGHGERRLVPDDRRGGRRVPGPRAGVGSLHLIRAGT